MIDVDSPRPGDKVAILVGKRRGVRGVIAELNGNTAVVACVSGTEVLRTGELQNYSAAARKAWITRPDRAVGRPKCIKTPKRMVSMRLDSDVWQALGDAVRAGLIKSREAAVNDWLRQMLQQLERMDSDGGKGE